MEIQFTCGHCGTDVPAPPKCGHAHGHCPECLWSKHMGFGIPLLDMFTEPCGGMMEPVRISKHKMFGRVVWQRCTCGYEITNLPVKRSYKVDAALLSVRFHVPGKTTRPVSVREIASLAAATRTAEQTICVAAAEGLGYSLIGQRAPETA